MKLGSLFAGIGGFELAATWAGITPVWSNERDKFCCDVLRKNFKHRIIEEDIRKINTADLEPIDILSGGFPCQPFSTAGRRKGTSDDRHLWPEMFRIIRSIRPTFVVGENVRGLVNWGGGLVFESVQADLESEGYETTSYILPACGVNAPHKRERIWIIAHTDRHDAIGQELGKIGSTSNGSQGPEEERERIRRVASRIHDPRTSTNADGTGRRQRNISKKSIGTGFNTGIHHEEFPRTYPNADRVGSEEPRRSIESSHPTTYGTWEASWVVGNDRWPLESPIRNGGDGFSAGLVRSAIAAAGNAIVPQVAYEIFKVIKQINL